MKNYNLYMITETPELPEDEAAEEAAREATERDLEYIEED